VLPNACPNNFDQSLSARGSNFHGLSGGVMITLHGHPLLWLGVDVQLQSCPACGRCLVMTSVHCNRPIEHFSQALTCTRPEFTSCSNPRGASALWLVSRSVARTWRIRAGAVLGPTAYSKIGLLPTTVILPSIFLTISVFSSEQFSER